ncbi:MAG: histidine kinase [Saprospiraceae bacterium]|nr:histidine kinase [Saprospiraceae bacterium]
MQRSKFMSAADKLDEALRENNDLKIATAYYALGDEYEKAGDYPTSESYFLKSEIYYKKLQDVQALAEVTRRIAKVQEFQSKKSKAVSTYNTAANYSAKSKDEPLKYINKKDAERIEASNISAEKEEEIIASKVREIEQSPALKDELPETYIQLADAQVRSNNLVPAIGNYQNAIQNVRNDPDQLITLTNKLSDTYILNNDMKGAIESNKKLLQQPEIQNNAPKKVEVIQNLSKVYLRNNDQAEAAKALEESYRIAVQTGQTLEARDIVGKLAEVYQLMGKGNKSVILYKSFLKDLEQVIKADSTLQDLELIALTEQKIKKLEEEQVLKDKLISKQNTINYALLGGIILLAILMMLIYKSLRSIRRRNKIIALQSLRKDMNPHFIFNSLNSINQFISQHDERTANQYLTKFSTLMRGVLEHSAHDFIPLSKEISMLENYLQLEYQRFKDKFTYTLHIDETIDQDHVLIPNMIIQPHLENAVWHGLRYKDSAGLLQVAITKNNNSIQVTIEDNGIGRAESHKLKTAHQRERKSKGTGNITQRIHLLNELYSLNIQCETEDLLAGAGTKINITFPADIADKIPKNKTL